MPKDNIDRAIKRGVGGNDTSDYFEKTYEGYGPGGVAVMVECLTDNVNRTVSEVRHAFSRSGGNLGTDGSVSWMFHKKGTIVYAKEKISDFDTFFEAALEAGADDVKEEGEVYEIECAPDTFSDVKEALDKLEINDTYNAAQKFLEAELLFPQSSWAPQSALMASYSYYIQN